ncbi:hypothetical protein LOD99_12570 [Oopsacas minuta]|uniref:Uncharacterized protein n=1 Tax=Oopsacas minuta TaxID=111878 RepID=A0AAV7JCJ4_9METZ|nr:hypothetical protein LOD99_12570 [Oopsacas minuta]
MIKMKQKQDEIYEQLQDKLDKATKRIAFLENENESKTEELSKFKQKQMETSIELDTAYSQLTEVSLKENQIICKDPRFEDLTEVLSTQLSIGQLELNIEGVILKIQNEKDTYSDPFYVGLYKCQMNIELEL